MPYESMEDVNPAIKGIEPPVTLAQANIIAEWADRIEEEEDVESPYAVAIAQFKETYKIADDSWVKREKERATTYECECLDCGHTVESEEHCVDLKCPECGGEMRRKERPGEGRAMIAIRELWEAVKRLFEQLMSQERYWEERLDPTTLPPKGRPKQERALSLNNVYEQVAVALQTDPDWPWIHGMYREDDGTLFVIISKRGKLYRAPVVIEDNTVTLGEQTEVTEEFAPVGETRGNTSVIRQADGRVRWLSISATSVLNKVGEIDSRALFDSFVTHATETGEYPYRCFYHQGEPLRTGLADFLARDGDVFITSGLYDDTPLALAEIAALERDAEAWAESIHYEPTEWPVLEELILGVEKLTSSVVMPVFNRGRMIEISTLPRERACAWFTAINVREVNRMREEVYTALVTLLDGDEEQAKGFAALVDGTNRQVKDEGLVTREVGEIEDEHEVVLDRETLRVLLGLDERLKALEGAENATEREFVLDETALDAIAGRFDELLAPLSARLDTLEASVGEEGANQATALDEAARGLLELDKRLETLEQGDEQKQAQWLADLPRSTRTRVTYRPREATQQEREAAGPQSMADIAAATLANAPRVQ